MNNLFINRIELKRNEIENSNDYPFNIKCLKDFDYLKLESPVTFLYGENGVGKSTLLEAIAISYGLNPEGGDLDINYNTYQDHSELSNYLRIGKFGKPQKSFFLRAESFYNIATAIDTGLANIMHYGGKELHNSSHGESFLQIIDSFSNNGLYILDEPEAALSPSRQMTLLCYINNLVNNGSQFIIATHSPILLSYNNSKILNLNENLNEISYEDTDVYKIYKDFLNNPYGMQKYLFE